jgi:transcription elongation factor Elf1
MIPRETVYYTDEPCPSCGHPLVITDSGTDLTRAECRACGHAENWLFGDPWTTGGDRW